MVPSKEGLLLNRPNPLLLESGRERNYYPKQSGFTIYFWVSSNYAWHFVPCSFYLQSSSRIEDLGGYGCVSTSTGGDAPRSLTSSLAAAPLGCGQGQGAVANNYYATLRLFSSKYLRCLFGLARGSQDGLRSIHHHTITHSTNSPFGGVFRYQGDYGKKI